MCCTIKGIEPIGHVSPEAEYNELEGHFEQENNRHDHVGRLQEEGE